MNEKIINAVGKVSKCLEDWNKRFLGSTVIIEEREIYRQGIVVDRGYTG